jgi:hypothetical protein
MRSTRLLKLVPPPAVSTRSDATSAGPSGGLHCSHENEWRRSYAMQKYGLSTAEDQLANRMFRPLEEAGWLKRTVRGRGRGGKSGTLTATTGLVVGYVQSGKTLSFTAVTALARDNRFQLVIIIAGACPASLYGAVGNAGPLREGCAARAVPKMYSRRCFRSLSNGRFVRVHPYAQRRRDRSLSARRKGHTRLVRTGSH